MSLFAKAFYVRMKPRPGAAVALAAELGRSLVSLLGPCLHEVVGLKGLNWGLAVSAALFSGWLMARDYRFSDAHVHYVDFFQESAGMDQLLEQMAAAGIEHVMLTGIPVAKTWDESEPKRPRYYAGDERGHE